MSNMPDITIEELQKRLNEKGINDVARELAIEGEDDKKPAEQPTPPQIDDATKVVALTALQKAIKDHLTELRDTVEDDMRAGYAFNGADRRTAKLSGLNIGTISLVKSKDTYYVMDSKAFNEYVVNAGLGTVKMNFNQAYATQLYHRLIEVADGNKDFKREDFEHMFESEVVLSKEFEKRLAYMDDVCMDTETGEVIPGIEPHPSYVKGIRVLTDKAPKIWRLLTLKSKDEIGKLLGAGE